MNSAPATKKKAGRIQPQADYRITFDGLDLSRLIAPNLISLSLSESRAEEADMLDIVLNDSRQAFAIPKRGANIRVAIGWIGSPLIDKGTFTVDEIEHSGAPDILTVRARSASMSNEMHERRERSWHGQTLGSIVHAIADRYSLKAAVADALKVVAINHIDQTHESDMSFLTRLAKRYDAVMNVKDKNLLLMPIGSSKTVGGKVLDMLEIKRSSGDQHRYHIAQRESYSAVRAYWHSNGKAKRRSVVVGTEDRTNVKVLPEEYATEAEARAAADAEYARTQRGQATMSYTLALGRPELFPETPVAMSGFKPEIDATPWLVKKTTHTLGEGGFTTALELEVRDSPTHRYGSNLETQT
jgi:uncharacterized protein